MRAVNPLVRRAPASRPRGSRIGKIALVEVRGRRTGRLLRIPMGLYDIGGAPTAFTGRRRRLNFTGSAPVAVTRRGQRHQGSAVLVDAVPGQIGAALRRALDNGVSPFDPGLRTSEQASPAMADLDAAGLSMIQFDLSIPGKES